MGYSPENCDQDINPGAYLTEEKTTEQLEKEALENVATKEKFESLKSMFAGTGNIAGTTVKYTKKETDDLLNKA
jgi:zinc finger protein